MHLLRSLAHSALAPSVAPALGADQAVIVLDASGSMWGPDPGQGQD